MARQKPRQGWVYWVNPNRAVVRCKLGHQYMYDLTLAEVECQQASCTLKVNPSRVLRKEHPYVVWSGNEFNEKYLAKTVTVIPLTSSENQMGLPTTYPIKPTNGNGLHKHSYVLIHQIITIDVNCLKNKDGKWKERIGQLTKKDKDQINERFKYYFTISADVAEDWFVENASIELLKKVFQNLPDEERDYALEALMDL